MTTRTNCVPSRTYRSSVAISLAALIAAPVASAASTFQANDLMNGYNSAFYSVSGGNGYFKLTTAVTTRTDFWKQAEEIEMVIDAYERNGSSTYLGMITELCNGFSSYYGSSWSGNSFNDDIMWGSIAYMRAYQKTGNTTFRNIAKTNFDLAYARAWDTVNGGLWWTTAKTGKNSCVQGPGAIASYLIYQVYGDSSYLTKAQGIFDWQKANLYNPATGAVWDGLTSTWVATYNIGTFVGAANYLGDVTNATKATDYMKNSMGSPTSTSNGENVLADYPVDTDLGGMHGIGFRWVARFMGDRNLQGSYLTWLQANADAAWNTRRTADNLSWGKLKTQTPAGTLYSWSCSNTVTALQVIPASYVSSTTYALVNRKSGLALAASGGGTGNNTALVQSAYSGSNSMRWAVANIGGNQYKMTGVASGRAVEVNGASTANDAAVQLYDYQNTSHQKVTFNGNHGAWYTPVFVHSGKAMTVYAASTSPGAAIIQYTFNNGPNAQWQLRNP